MARHVLISLNEVQSKLTPFINNGVVAFDTETTSLNYSQLSIEGISFSNGIDTYYIDLVDNQQKKDIIDWLRIQFKKLKVLIGHNIVFDLKVLKKYGIPFEHCELFCTMVADHLLDERRQHGLKYLAHLYLVEETVEYEDAIKFGKHSKEFYNYCLNDSEWTWRIAQIQKQELIDKDLTELFRQIEMPFQLCLIDMETTGILVDKKEMVETTKSIKESVTKFAIEMYELLNIKYQIQPNLFNTDLTVISKVNFSSNQQLVDIIQNKLGIEIKERTKKGSVSIGKEALNNLKGKHLFIDLLIKYKTAQKLLSAFFEPLPSFIQENGKIYPHFKDIGTETGRLSSSNPNFQQLPRYDKKKLYAIDVRKCFIAPQGYKMITCDFSGQELRILTQVAQEPKLIEEFKQGKDIHLSTANDFFNLGIPEEGLYESSPQYENYKDKFKSERDKSKTINFGIAYGKGAFGFSKDFNITEDEAQKLLDKYFGRLPRVQQAISNCQAEVSSKGYVRTMFGRYRHFEQKMWEGRPYYSKESFRQAFNFLIQGAGADMMRMAMINVRKWSKQHPEYQLQNIFTVHDEAGYIVKEEYVDITTKYIKEIFESVIDFSIPIKAKIGVGMNYSEAK